MSNRYVSYVHLTCVPVIAYLLAYLVEARVQVLRLDVIAPAGDERESLAGAGRGREGG